MERGGGVEPLRLSRQGDVQRLRQGVLRQQRLVQRPCDAGSDDSGGCTRAVASERQAVDAHTHQPVHRGDDEGRHLRQRASECERHLGDGLGPQERDPRRDGRRQDLARLSAPEGLAQLRRRARLEHRVAAHPRDRRQGKPLGDDARHVLEVSRVVRPEEREGDSSVLQLPEGHRRLLRVERQGRVRLRRLGEERVPEQAPRERRRGGSGDFQLKPLVRRPEGPRFVRSRARPRLGLARGAGEGGHTQRRLSARGLRQENPLRDGRARLRPRSRRERRWGLAGGQKF